MAKIIEIYLGGEFCQIIIGLFLDNYLPILTIF